MSKLYWTCADGRKLPIEEMTDLHVFNTVKMLFRRYDLPSNKMPEQVIQARVFLETYVKESQKIKKSVKNLFNRSIRSEIHSLSKDYCL